MKARLIVSGREPVGADAFAEIVIWKLPQSLKGSTHGNKYRLAYVVEKACVMRYDNELGKGDHRHIEGREERYDFTTLGALLEAFWRDVARLRS